MKRISKKIISTTQHSAPEKEEAEELKGKRSSMGKMTRSMGADEVLIGDEENRNVQNLQEGTGVNMNPIHETNSQQYSVS